jgi:hypothetical protein
LLCQDLESEKIKNHLTILAKRFNKAIGMIQPLPIERLPRQSQPFSELQVIVEKEHKKLLARKVLIERRKEEQERQMLEMVCSSLLLHYHIWFLSFHFRLCRFSAHFSLLACLRNLNHLGQMS